MSKNTPPPMPISQLYKILEGVSHHIHSAHRDPLTRKSLANLLAKFVNDTITPIVPHEQLHPSCNTPIQPSTNSEELKNIQNTLQALTKVVTGLQKKTPPPTKTPSAQPPTPKPTYASKASSKPANPSLVIMLSHLAGNADFTRPRPVEICTILNNALSATPHNQTHVSAARWTAKGNLVVTGGHLTAVQQLQLASPLITKAFTNTFSTTVTPFTPPHTRANVKWSKILINGLPTGVTDGRGAYTPDECHTALASENPSYSPLIIAQKPLWVKPPHSFTAGSSSSLVMAIEDPDGSKARALLGAKHLYAFGTRATLRKWKQRPTHPTPSSPQTSDNSDNDDDTEIAVAPSQLPPTFTPSGPSASSTQAAPKPMATRRTKAKKQT
ncbi:hypothetical protein F5888DRAFT_1802400 [Russula emetica]|nr:hypothetical protein F5888DRAFT_1802400 [Russula emetica]